MSTKLARFQALARPRALFRYLGLRTTPRHDRQPQTGPRTPSAGLFGLLVDNRRRDWD